MKKKTAALLLALIMALGLFLSGCGGRAAQGESEAGSGSPEAESGGVFAGGSGTEDDPYVIATAADLNAVRSNLAACYRLDADIDLSGVEWTPVGVFHGADDGVPVEADAFTGIFDGGSHTISNLTVGQPEDSAVGLFGCVRGAHIYNLTVDTVTVDGRSMAGAVAGYAYNSRLTAVSLTGSNFITGHNGAGESAEKIGGMVGGAKNSLIDSCAARANIVLPDFAGEAGILCGGLEVTSVINGYATGTLTAGNECCGLGAVSGSGLGSEEFTNCTAENVRITVGDNVSLLGGLTGYAGGYEDESESLNVTAISRCVANNVEIVTSEGAEAVGAIIGGSFRSGEEQAETVFTIADCTASVTINGGEAALSGESAE